MNREKKQRSSGWQEMRESERGRKEERSALDKLSTLTIKLAFSVQNSDIFRYCLFLLVFSLSFCGTGLDGWLLKDKNGGYVF